MTVLCTIELRGIVVELIGSTVDDTIVGRNATHLILIIGSVHTNVVAELLANHIVPGEVELKSLVLHIATIDGWCACTNGCQHRSRHQPILSGLDIIVEVYIQVTANQSGIQTDIELLRGLPSDIGISHTTGISTPVGTQHRDRLCVVITRGTKQIMSIRILHRSEILVVGDILITHLTPADAQFQEVHP